MRYDSFTQMLRYWAEESPAETALCYARDGKSQRCSWGELLRRVQDQAEELKGSGKRCAAVLCDRTVENVVHIFGAVLAGLRVVLLNASATEDLLWEQIAFTEAELLLGAGERHAALAPALTEQGTEGPGELLFFTSGAMTRAKAVVLTESSLCASAWNGSSLLPLDVGERVLCELPLDHVFGFVCGLLWGMGCGACVVLGRGMRFCQEDLALFHPTAMPTVPAALRIMVKNRLLEPPLRTILVGAADCRWELMKTVSAMGIRVCYGYGLTETSSGIALSLGEDPDAMTLCPEVSIQLAEDGEILVSAPSCMFQGYWKSPEDTAAALQDGLLHTGDLGSLDSDGRLHITGRKKEILVFPDGTKLWLPEYERDLVRALETRELAVVQTEAGPVLVLPEGGADREAALRVASAFLSLLPRNQRLTDVIYIPGPIPRTATGKVKRWELQKLLETMGIRI